MSVAVSDLDEAIQELVDYIRKSGMSAYEVRKLLAFWRSAQELSRATSMEMPGKDPR